MTATRISSSSSSSGSLPGFYDVTSSTYGAVGDGVTNDAAAIQSAIDAAKTNGGIVYLDPRKTFLLGSTALNCNNSSKAFRVTGMGNGGWGHINVGSPTLLWTGGAGTGPMVKCYSVHGFEFDHIHLCYDNAAYNGDMIDVDGNPLLADCTNFEIHNLSFRGKLSGLHYQTARSNIRLNKAIIGDIHHIQYADAVNGLRIGDPGGSYVVGVEFDHFTCNNSADAHVLVGTADGEAIKLSHPIFEAGNNTTAIRGATTAGDGGQNQLYSFQVENGWFGDASAATNWIKDLHAVSSKNIVIGPNNRFADVVTTTASHLSGDGLWLVFGNTFEGGDLMTFSSPGGGGSGEGLILIGNHGITRKKVSNISTNSKVWEFGNVFSYNGSYAQTIDNTPYDRVGSSRFSVGGASKPAQPDVAAALTEEDLILAAWANAMTAGVPVDKGLIGVGKTPNPAALRSLNNIAPSAVTTGVGGWNAQVGTGPFFVIEAQGANTQAGCKLGFNGAIPVVQAARAGQLTDSTGGTVSGTLAAGIADAVAKNAIASLAAKVNALETIIHNLGLSA